MRRIFEMLPQMASSTAPLLIWGERGTGRGALAETVHILGNKDPAGPIIQITCRSAQAEKMLASARSNLNGTHGTLVLEDISLMRLQMQKQLVAWIEDGEGPPPCRIISTALSTLQDRVAQGFFPRSLYYRLNVLSLFLPNLKERCEDIPLLVDQFIQEMNEKRGKQIDGVSPQAMNYLFSMNFEENVRELRRIIDRAHHLCREEVIDLKHIFPSQRKLHPFPSTDAKRMIEEALDIAQGKIAEAADILQIHRSTLWRKIKRYRIRNG